MASVVAESCVGARNTVRADACLVDRTHPKKTIYSHGHLSPSGLCWSSGSSALMVASEIQSVEVHGIEDRYEI
jgi:hypothetical protein